MRRPRFLLALAALTAVVSLACSSSDDATAAGGAGSSAAGAGGSSAGSAGAGGESEGGDYDPTPVGGARPTKVFVPAGYAEGTAMPLVVLLHGYGASGAMQELLFKMKPEADKRGFLYVHPDGTKDADNLRFWNAGPACCNFGGVEVDDVAYLTGLVDEIGKRFTVDKKRVYFLGHSNGAFMSYRMACQTTGLIAGIGVLAGMMNLDPGACPSGGPLNVVHVHGDIDDTIPYAGGVAPKGMGATFPSAAQSAGAWAAKNGCGASPEEYDTLDLETTVAGAETHRARFPGCAMGAKVELWTMQKIGHIPDLNATFAPTIMDALSGK